MKFVMSYSFGKDSALALYRMVQAGHTPTALLTTVNPSQNRSWVHGIQPDLMQEVARSLRLPLILCECATDRYAQDLGQSLAQAKALGAEACAFGDIDIEGHADFDRECCAAAGLACELPLWQGGREPLLRECLNAGFRAIIKMVQADQLPESLLGKTLTMEIARQIAETGADICGENGEYHTFVYDGPLFSRPVPVKSHGIVDLGRSLSADLRLCEGGLEAAPAQ